MSKLPIWARKPECKYGTVIATSRGWKVKETGEYLKLVKDLEERLKSLKVETDEVVSTSLEADLSDSKPESMESIKEDVKTSETASESDLDTKPDVVEDAPKPKRRGRKPKASTTKQQEQE